MLQSVLTLAFRKFSRDISFSMITLTGWIIGLTMAILVFVWMRYELSYDRYHADNEKVFAVLMNEQVDGGIETYEETPVPLADYFSLSPTDIQAFTRIDNTQALLNVGTKSVQRYGVYADTGYFEVFHPQLIAGNLSEALPDNHSVVITKELAGLLFENGDALGKMVTVGNQSDFKVTGVMSGFPANSSLHYVAFVLPFNAKLRQKDDGRIIT